MNKDLVIYYSKNGTTMETVEKMKKASNNQVDVLDINSKDTKDLSQYNRIFIGCGVVASNLPGKVVKYIKANSTLLKSKKVVFFIHGLISESNYSGMVDTAVKNLIPSSNYEVVYLGGKLDINKQNFIIKKMLLVIAKQNNLDPNNANTLNEKSISKLLKYFEAN